MNPIYAQSVLSIIIRLYGAKVPYIPRALYEGWQLRFPWTEGDVACHKGTYGSAHGKVETYEFPWDDGGVTMLDPNECAEKIIAYYREITSP